MKKKDLLLKVEEMAAPICADRGVFVWDITFEKEGRDNVLTVFIDRQEGGIFIEDCEAVSRFIDPLLDDAVFDSLPSYTLSVSSAGVERRLTRPKHFAWAVGKTVDAGLFAGHPLGREVTGTLSSATDDSVGITVDGTEHVLPKDKITSIKLHFEF